MWAKRSPGAWSEGNGRWATPDRTTALCIWRASWSVSGRRWAASRRRAASSRSSSPSAPIPMRFHPAARPGPPTRTPESPPLAASSVAAGIFVSRVFGMAREMVFAHHFGTGDLVDAWRTALRIPNVLQNLLGEGTLSASFIPVYVRLLEEGREEEAGRAAGAVLGLLAAVAGVLAALGVWAAPWLVTLIAPGFSGDARADTVVSLLRLLFPMTGVLVLSAWALGILNSHRRFFVSYVAPALWNLAMIVAVVGAAARGFLGTELILAMAWGALAGGVLQLLFQIPFLLRFLKHVVPSISTRVAGVREVVTNFVPVFAARGAVNLSALVDTNLASRLAPGAVGIMGYALPLYLLPVSLFGMSVAAAELPEMSRDRAAGARVVRERTERAVGTVLFWLIPITLGYIVFREEVMAIYRTGGAFAETDAVAAGAVLAAYALGLPASGTSRVLSSAFYALGDTRTPARIAYARILVSAAVGVALMFPLDGLKVGELGLGAAGLAVGASVGAWLEQSLLRRRLGGQLPGLSLGGSRVVRCVAAALAATAVGLVPRLLLPALHPIVGAAATILPVAITYLWVAHLLGVSPERLRRLYRRGWRR
ncbi:MAG: murein biosynthesis integral membrane protein MurJ [Gemmatimonadetes bacterium]|nr:murein biosynthesis integral membrane protein MurJ [Gemmatimonadota bacterium]MYH53011.1 murein biosynthesis integral membrane protein MurJ [Gemmatimonadota bacterium]MYK66561.1 murein biosynthesis integral membrane protein MurJ [Gemmatimonadota bacterium]